MSSTPIRALLLALAILSPVAARAAPVFPSASGVGLEPPAGMKPAVGFEGFRAGAASIVITELPKAAYAQIDPERARFVTQFAAKGADDVEINGVHGFLVKGTQAIGATHFRKWIVVLDGKSETALVIAQAPTDDAGLSDAAIETALHSIAFRERPGLEQQVAALPFAVGDLAGFRISAAALGAALILVDGSKDVDPKHSQAHIVVAQGNGNPPAPDARIAYAKAQLQAFQAVRTTQVQSSKLFDADGAQWAQIDAAGSEGQEETPVAITYFIRFGSAGLSIVCVAPQADAARYAERFKTVALSVKPKG